MTIHAGVANRKGWVRIDKRMPPPFNLCPICQHDHWCMFHIDESAVICGRTDLGYDKDLGDAGFLFRLKRDDRRFNMPPMDWLEQRRIAKQNAEPERSPAELAALFPMIGVEASTGAARSLRVRYFSISRLW